MMKWNKEARLPYTTEEEKIGDLSLRYILQADIDLADWKLKNIAQGIQTLEQAYSTLVGLSKLNLL